MITKGQGPEWAGSSENPPPSAWVCRHAAQLAPGSSVLDLACGSGRHARYLAAQGHAVLAVDRAPELAQWLGGIPGLAILNADLENAPWPLAGQRFDGVVVTNYLHRPLWPMLMAALADEGLLIYETFMQGNARFGRPANPDFLLQSQELLDVAQAAGLQVLAYEEGEVSVPKPAVVQRICARRQPMA